MLPCRAHRHGSPPASKFPGTRTSGPFQTVEIVADDPPDRVRVNTVISMVKYISETSDRLPRLLRRQRFGITMQSPSGLADDQEQVQDRVKRLLVSAESREIEPYCGTARCGRYCRGCPRSGVRAFRRQAWPLFRWRASATPCGSA